MRIHIFNDRKIAESKFCFTEFLARRNNSNTENSDHVAIHVCFSRFVKIYKRKEEEEEKKKEGRYVCSEEQGRRKCVCSREKTVSFGGFVDLLVEDR